VASIRFAIPKGSLQEETVKFLSDAGYRIKGLDRSYRPKINDPDIKLKLLRPQEIPYLVEAGYHDIGITGYDWIIESGADVDILLDLEYGWVKLVIAVPKNLDSIDSLNELLETWDKESRTLRISTEYPNIAVSHLMNNDVYRRLYGDIEPQVVTPWWVKGDNPDVRIYLSFGATEAKPPEDSDAILDVTATGTTLERNNLKVIEEIMESTAVLIANKEAMKDSRREKIMDIKALLRGVIEGRKRVHIFLNVGEENLSKILDLLPALKSPTISKLARDGWYSINTVLLEEEFLRILPSIRRLAQGLVVYRPKQILMLDGEVL